MQTPKNYIFTSESVSEGHPDKVCDQISDSILDLFLTADNQARVACETLATTNRVILSGEVGISKNKDMVSPDKIEALVRSKVKEIGYEQDGFHWEKISIHNYYLILYSLIHNIQITPSSRNEIAKRESHPKCIL